MIELELPVYGKMMCYKNEVALSIQLLNCDGFLIVKTNGDETFYSKNGLYSNFGLIKFSAEKLMHRKSILTEKKELCINYEDIISYKPKTIKELNEYFIKTAGYFNEKNNEEKK